MARAAVATLDEAAGQLAGGLVVAPEDAAPPHPTVAVVVGDHPVPGAMSARAADRVEEVAARVRMSDLALVLLSGGTTSLVAAPVAGVTAAELSRLFELLLASGLDITAMNAVRRRFLRWGAGRLAARLAPARVHCLAMSDVIGDDLAAIGSGPCVADPLTARDVADLLRRAELLERLPAAMRALLAPGAPAAPETPKPGDAALAGAAARVIASNRLALDAAAARARALGVSRVVVDAEPLRGEAAAVGAALAHDLVARLRRGEAQCVVWGGETTVTLRDAAVGLGGRCQELALSAAAVLDHAGVGGGVTLLAAGTDGRDGPTDAAGAIVDGGSWRRAPDAGVDPERALAAHDAHRALDAAGALLRPGLTGTNVMDVVIGVVEPDAR